MQTHWYSLREVNQSQKINQSGITLKPLQLKWRTLIISLQWLLSIYKAGSDQLSMLMKNRQVQVSKWLYKGPNYDSKMIESEHLQSSKFQDCVTGMQWWVPSQDGPRKDKQQGHGCPRLINTHGKWSQVTFWSNSSSVAQIWMSERIAVGQSKCPFWHQSTSQCTYNRHSSIRTGPWSNGKRRCLVWWIMFPFISWTRCAWHLDGLWDRTGWVMFLEIFCWESLGPSIHVESDLTC